MSTLINCGLVMNLKIEYITDPVILPRLCCPTCGSKVRQIREELSAQHGFAIALCGEPLAWLVMAIGGMVGYATQTLWALVVFWVIFGVPSMAWLYISRLRKSEFLCSKCEVRSSYTEVRGAAQRTKP